jgi:hypothetical protein
MLSDVIHTIASLHQVNGGILFALAPFTLFVWLAYKLMQSFIRSGNTIIIAAIGLFALGLANSAMGQGQVIQTLFYAVPLVFIGREVYGRLVYD